MGAGGLGRFWAGMDSRLSGALSCICHGCINASEYIDRSGEMPMYNRLRLGLLKSSWSSYIVDECWLLKRIENVPAAQSSTNLLPRDMRLRLNSKTFRQGSPHLGPISVMSSHPRIHRLGYLSYSLAEKPSQFQAQSVPLHPYSPHHTSREAVSSISP